MKTFLIGGILGPGIFLQGRGTAVVNRSRGGADVEYYRARDSGLGDNVSQHPVRSIEQKNIRGSTASVTNVHRNYNARNHVARATVRCSDSSGAA